MPENETAATPARNEDRREEETNVLTVALYGADGTRAGEVDLPETVFAEPAHMAAMHQAYVRQMANRRQGTAATKTRGMVAGGGRKPHRQKGTGRARHGSTREPQMRGGGTVFGPKPRSYRQRMPRKMRRLALRSALSVKATEGKVSVIESFAFDQPKTSQMAALLEQMGVERSALLVLPAPSQNVTLSIGNLSWAKAVLATNLNLYDIFTHELLVVHKDALEVLESTFAAASSAADERSEDQ